MLMTKPFWESDAPQEHEKKHLDKKQVQQAKARARAAGRPYPNLVDNAAVARTKGEKK
ncbi:MAG: hypothetical protein ACR2IJ_02935 [Fluviibacter sp.]